ncbi:hypothetical protein NLG97_g5551 [Lecanicillium saksenae]|uniref:Uncharacterized protein n=1 Tax=Lecanicillium saksenae TaxID=468837 RepID=A0ACC1QS47_9HYPO|nr:hypothetical protein NLG97_g5551 [Lecanicillium saksenae]
MPDSTTSLSRHGALSPFGGKSQGPEAGHATTGSKQMPYLIEMSQHQPREQGRQADNPPISAPSLLRSLASSVSLPETRYCAMASRWASPQAAATLIHFAMLLELDDLLTLRGEQKPEAESSNFTSITKPAEPLSNTSLPRFVLDDEHGATSTWLESISTNGNSTRKLIKLQKTTHTTNVPFKVAPISELLQRVQAIQDGAATSWPPTAHLPSREESINLSQYFLENVQYLHPVFDPHSVQRVIDAVYAQPDTLIQCKTADIALLLSVLASASHLWRPQRSRCLVFLSAKEAAFVSSMWINTALDILDHSRRTTAASIEVLQASIVISYVIFNSQGFSPMFRSLHSNIIMLARDLSLHKTDSPHKSGETTRPRTEIEVDVKRRLWWHIAATDWLLAFTPGPQEGTYSILPSHINVNLPYAPEQYSSEFEDIPLLSTSYFLQRIRLAEICREVVDSLPGLKIAEDVDYDHVIFLDGKFEELVKTLPVFFRLDRGHDLLYAAAPQLTIQCCLIHLGIYTRRSRLHQSFLTAGLTNPKYAFSRAACLDSSRAVLKICYMLEEKKDDLELIPARLATVVHHVFMAAVVLLMDLCSHTVEELEGRREVEVNRACRMLDSLKQDSVMAARLAQPLMDILQKHREGLQKTQSSERLPAVHPGIQPPVHISSTFQESRAPISDGGDHPEGAAQEEHESSQCERDWEFDAMMQEYIDMGPSIDGPFWSSLFDDLDSHQTEDGWHGAFSG